MKVVVVTTASDPFAGVFWKAYQEGGGQDPSALVILPTKQYRPKWQALVEALLIFGLLPLLRLSVARYLRVTWHKGDMQAGLPLRLGNVLSLTKTTILHVSSINRGAGLELLKDINPEFIVSVGCPEILRSQVLEIPRTAALNIHNARLPAYRGLFGTFWEICCGESDGFVTIHQMVPKVDSGPTIVSESIKMHYPIHFLDVMIAKKALGGRLLAQLLSHYDEYLAESLLVGESAKLTESDLINNYYHWPSFRDLAWFWRNKHKRPDNR